MRKLLIVLLSCLCIVSVSPVYGAQQTADDEYTKLRTAVTLGLLDGSALSRAQETITRGEFIYAVMQIFGNPLPNSVAPFTDLPEREDYRRAINAAYEMGLISGYEDGSIRPMEPITRMHAAQLLAKGIGYSDLIAAGKSAAQACEEAGICSFAEACDTLSCTVADAAELLLSAGNANMVGASMIGSQSMEYVFREETLFSNYLNIYQADGIIRANEYTYLDEEGHLGQNSVQIGEEIFQSVSDEVKGLLGYRVEVYYKQRYGSDLREIISCLPKGNEAITITAENVIGYRDGRLEYYDENGRSVSESFPISAVNVIYNNRLLLKASAEDFAIASGSITLIDNDDDGSYEVVSVLSYRNAIVDTVDRQKEEVYFKFGEKPLSLAEDSGLSFLSADGSKAYVIELAEWDVLSIAESKDGELIRAVYIPESVDGVIESIAENQGNYIVSIDGKEYTLTAACQENQGNELTIGKYVMLYPDIDGKIAAVNSSVNSGEQYGYLIAMELGKGLAGGVRAKYLDCDGTVKVSELADKVKLDGTIYHTENDANIFLSLNPQLMMYRINENGVISYIDTAYSTDENGKPVSLGEKESETSLYKYYDGYSGDDQPVETEQLVYKKDNMILGGKVALTQATYIFCVPTQPQSAKDSDYKVLNTSNYLSNDGRYAVRAYKTSTDSLSAEAIVMHVDVAGTNVPSDTAISVVESVTRGLDADGNECYILNCYTGTNKYRYQTRQSSIFDDLTLDGASYMPSGGDILKLSVDTSGSITACELVYSYSQNKMNGSNPSDSLYATYRVEIAYAYQMDKTSCMTTTTPLESGKTYTQAELSNLEMHNLSRFKVLLYDTKREKVSTANAGSVIGFVNTGGYASSRVFIYTRNGNSQTFVIYQ